VGHADLVETQKGEWWSVMLAKRRLDGFTLLGRESFMARVEFDDHDGIPVPVYNRGEGKLLEKQERPDLPWTPVEDFPVRDEFDGKGLALNWNVLRTPYSAWWKQEGGKLEMQLRPEVADSLVNPSLIATRIEDHHFLAATQMEFSPKKENEQAGMILYRTSLNHYLLLREKKEVVLVKVKDGEHQELARVPYKGKQVIFSAEASGVDVVFRFGPSEDRLEQIGTVQSMGLLSDEEAWGFNGPYVGMYATSGGMESQVSAAFEWFEYEGMD
jgi:alpha-N-arabinofuranosidase